MDARSILGWNVRRLRVSMGISQEGLALATDIDRSYVGRVERGSENVTIATIEAIAAVLDCPVAALFSEPPQGAELAPSLRSGRKPKAKPKSARQGL